MKKKIYALSFSVALALALTVFISANISRTAASTASDALNALPASDIVVTVNTQRLMNETLPTMLADNPTLLAKINDKVEKFKKETNVDLRTFDSIAVGLRFKPGSADDFSGVVIARGHFNSLEVIESGFNAAKSKGEVQRREEQYEGKTIHIIVPQRRARVVQEKKAEDKSSASVETEQHDVKVGVKKTGEPMAIVALDGNTLAVGDVQSVRAAIDAQMGRSRVDAELVRMATQNPSALVGFSGKVPPSVTEKVAANSRGPEAKYMAAVREFYGSFSTVGTDAETIIAVRTERPNEAQDIGQALNALKLLGGFGMSQSAKGEARSLAGILKDLSITTQGNEVQIKLRLNQKDIAPFMRGF